jgi:uncharacterized protein (TIRG00374 family)
MTSVQSASLGNNSDCVALTLRARLLDYNPAMRKWFFALILIFAAYFVYTHREELQLVLDVLGQGDWNWMASAAAVQLVWLVAISLGFYVTYVLVGIRERFVRMVPLTVAANFVNVVAPSYGVGALAVLIADGQQRDLPAAKVSTAAILYLVYDYIAIACVVIIGVFRLSARNVLDTVLITATTFVLSIAAALLIMTFLGVRSPDKLGKIILWLATKGNRLVRPILKRELVDLKDARLFAQDISEGLRSVRRSPGMLVLPLLITLAQKALMVMILFLVSAAFHQPLDLDTLVSGFTTSYLFTIFSVTPSGVGFVEGALTLYLKALGAPLARSAVISLAYRGITFWLTLAYGLFAVRWVGYPKARPESETKEEQAPHSLQAQVSTQGSRFSSSLSNPRAKPTEESLEETIH